MSIITGKVGKVFVPERVAAFTTEATTEDGSTKIYQIDAVAKRNWDPNTPITISIGNLDSTYYSSGINSFEGKVKLLTTGEVTLTVSGNYVDMIRVAEIYGWALSMSLESNATTELGDDWETYLPLGKSAEVTLSRYRIDEYFDTNDNGYQEAGLTLKTDKTETGLAAATQYYFKVNVDGAGEVEYNITTASDTTYEAVVILINIALAAAGSVATLVNGDLRFSSAGEGSTIALAAGTTGTDLFVTLTGFTAFDDAIVGGTSPYFLLKLYEDATAGYWVKALKSSTGITEAIGAINQDAITFAVDANVGYFS